MEPLAHADTSLRAYRKLDRDENIDRNRSKTFWVVSADRLKIYRGSNLYIKVKTAVRLEISFETYLVAIQIALRTQFFLLYLNTGNVANVDKNDKKWMQEFVSFITKALFSS